MFLKALSKQVIDYNLTQSIAMKKTVTTGQARNLANNKTWAFGMERRIWQSLERSEQKGIALIIVVANIKNCVFNLNLMLFPKAAFSLLF